MRESLHLIWYGEVAQLKSAATLLADTDEMKE